MSNDIIDFFILLIIAVVFVALIVNVYSVIVPKNKRQEKDHEDDYENNSKKINEYNKYEDKYEEKKCNTLIVTFLIFMLLSGLLHNNKKFELGIVTSGVFSGSAIAVAYYLFLNWNNYGDITHVMFLAGIFSSIVAAVYNNIII
jgi:NADH:ubiquinone oxidoreductase subunit 3 (subunit A)